MSSLPTQPLPSRQGGTLITESQEEDSDGGCFAINAECLMVLRTCDAWFGFDAVTWARTSATANPES